MLVSAGARAQQTLAGLSGAVRDGAGNPVAGVTVEAGSPALIERVRSVVTDAQGQFKLVDLPPGTYSVSFKANGFSTTKQDGIELSAGFTGAMNISLKPGNPNEVVTVTGAVSAVDTRTAAVQQAVSSEVQQQLASAQAGATAAASVTQGVANSSPDVGGASGAYAASGGVSGQLSVRGKGSVKRLFDGLRVENIEGGGNTSYFINQNIVDAQVVETAGGNAESMSSGGFINAVPKSGGNQYKAGLSGLYTREAWQSDNLDDSLRSRGLATVNKVGAIWDYGGTFGGPLKKDKAWFFFAPKFWGDRLYAAGSYWNDTQGTPFYTPANGTGKDLLGVQRAPAGLPVRRGDNYEDQRSQPVRVTWQATPKQKFNFFIDYPERACTCRRAPTTTSPEATAGYHFRDGLIQTTWSSARTSKLLLEAGWSYALGSWPTFLQPTSTEKDIAIIDNGKGFTYNANPSYNGRIGQDMAGTTAFSGSSFGKAGDGHRSDRMAERLSVAYITGSHAMKFGMQIEHGWHTSYTWVNQNVNYVFINGVPNQVVQWTTPQEDFSTMKADMGIYAQDQWTLRRLTLNYGLRYSYFNAGIPAQHIDPTQFVPRPRDFSAVNCVPCWNDIDPRVGAAYDVFGNGRTAFKAAIGRYVGVQVLAIANANNPLTTSVNSANRTWNDMNGNYVPDCDLTNFSANGECGPVLNNNFGNSNPAATRYDSGVTNGWGARDYIWDLSAEVNHAINRQMTVNAGYYRNWGKNYIITDNTAVSPSDYSPYCITAPADPKLPGGGGYPICGLYDISAAKVRSVQNVIYQSSTFGNQTNVNNYFGFGVNTRFSGGKRFGINMEIGRQVADVCFVVNNPEQANFNLTSANATGTTASATNVLPCHTVSPWLANMQLKATGSYPLPYGFSVNGTYQNSAGAQDLANWLVPSTVIKPSLGRDLAAGANQTASVPLITPGTQYESRRNQLDFRFSKTLKLTSRSRFQFNFDVYNVLNNNAVLTLINNYNPPGTVGSQWLKPTKILDARLFEIGGRLDF
jgi:hypothetical protein